MSDINFGGFVPVSTVDWYGKCVSVVFLRGCSLRCPYCHNKKLQSGRTMVDVDDLISQIKESSIVTSGVVFSGGEPIEQLDKVMSMCQKIKDIGMQIGMHTSGINPIGIHALIDCSLVDKISIDYKIRIEESTNMFEANVYERSVWQSIGICSGALDLNAIADAEIVFTIFKGDEGAVIDILENIPKNIKVILNRGNLTDSAHGYEQVSIDDLKNIASTVNHPSIMIRSREEGQVSCA